LKVSKGGSIKIGDLGLAIELKSNSETLIGGPVGDSLYRAPEILNRMEYSFPADVYSYGIMMMQTFYQWIPDE